MMLQQMHKVNLILFQLFDKFYKFPIQHALLHEKILKQYIFNLVLKLQVFIK